MYQIDMKFDKQQQQRLRGWSCMVVKHFQDGGRPPFRKSLYRHVSAKNHPLSMKFCTQQQILNWRNVTWSKMKKLHWTDSEFDRTYFLYSHSWRMCHAVVFRLPYSNQYCIIYDYYWNVLTSGCRKFTVFVFFINFFIVCIRYNTQWQETFL